MHVPHGPLTAVLRGDFAVTLGAFKTVRLL